jgi:acyl-CoA synthetase (AMP-forming)/AMP-acid ligase II
LAERLPGCAIGQGWGLTETSGTLSVPRRGTGSRPGTVGRLLPGTELRVVDPATGVDTGQDGELWVRGPQVMAGYLGRPTATAEMIDGDGWLRTGDLGHVDPDGSVVIVDRLKELIKVSAFQVAPAELEGLLVEHPAIADAAVVRRPDARTGEAPVALVVPGPGADVDPDAIREWVAARVAPYKRLREVHVVDSLPRTPSGKLLRRLLTVEPVPA